MEFETVKLALLLHRLDGVSRPELHHLIIDAADSAADLARTTPYPRLLFPCLFAERAEVALQQEAIRNRHYWKSLGEIVSMETQGDAGSARSMDE